MPVTSSNGTWAFEPLPTGLAYPSPRRRIHAPDNAMVARRIFGAEGTGESLMMSGIRVARGKKPHSLAR